MKAGAASGDMDAYIRRQPPAARDKLNLLRATIQAAAPKAQATIRYQIPTFQHHGNLVHFAAWKTHLGFYPASSGIGSFAKELAPYETSRGTVKFPLDQPLPLRLIARIVKFRVKENEARAGAKSRPRPGRAVRN
jgi:uncharacterized protein YdhG (YjbR/CyaY superfamily)